MTCVNLRRTVSILKTRSHRAAMRSGDVTLLFFPIKTQRPNYLHQFRGALKFQYQRRVIDEIIQNFMVTRKVLCPYPTTILALFLLKLLKLHQRQPIWGDMPLQRLRLLPCNKTTMAESRLNYIEILTHQMRV